MRRGSEAISDRQLPDPHETRLNIDAAEARGINRAVIGKVAELRRVREVEDLEADLPALSAGKRCRLCEHEVYILPELEACVRIRARGIAERSSAWIRVRARAEPSRIRLA